MNGPDDYKCHACGNHVLYLRDHKPDCRYYVNPWFGKAVQS